MHLQKHYLNQETSILILNNCLQYYIIITNMLILIK